MLDDAVTQPSVCILFALPEEAAPLRRRQTGTSSVHIVCSGTGSRSAAAQAVQTLDSLPHPPTYLLICGFAGGLSASAVPGSLVLADIVADSIDGGQPERQSHPLVYRADSRLLAIAESVRLSGITLQRGTLLTGSLILTRATQKEALAQRLTPRPLAVDMETLGAARVAQERGVPWLAVRAITDGLYDDMPLDFNRLADAEGNVSRVRVVQTMLVRPWTIPAVLRLGARSGRAARNLAAFIEAFLERLPE
jgi:adenosylhomocysteine nucleosidase